METGECLVTCPRHLCCGRESLKTVCVNVIASGSAGRRQPRSTSVADTLRNKKPTLGTATHQGAVSEELLLSPVLMNKIALHSSPECFLLVSIVLCKTEDVWFVFHMKEVTVR